MKIFDTHAHYDDVAFDGDREQLLNCLMENGIGNIINVGADIQSTRNTLLLTQQYPFVYGAVGVHPNETGELNDEQMNWLRQIARKEKIIAIGEIGLDYYWKEPEPEIQKYWFIRQLELAREIGRAHV